MTGGSLFDSNRISTSFGKPDTNRFTQKSCLAFTQEIYCNFHENLKEKRNRKKTSVANRAPACVYMYTYEDLKSHFPKSFGVSLNNTSSHRRPDTNPELKATLHLDEFNIFKRHFKKKTVSTQTSLLAPYQKYPVFILKSPRGQKKGCSHDRHRIHWARACRYKQDDNKVSIAGNLLSMLRSPPAHQHTNTHPQSEHGFLRHLFRKTLPRFWHFSKTVRAGFPKPWVSVHVDDQKVDIGRKQQKTKT